MRGLLPAVLALATAVFAAIVAFWLVLQIEMMVYNSRCNTFGVLGCTFAPYVSALAAFVGVLLAWAFWPRR